MNRGDYVMYNGEEGPIWQPKKMYEWNGTEWTQLVIEENRWKYLDGINDLTEGALDGVFGTAFVNTLLAKTAIIEKLFAETITLNGESGCIQSEAIDPVTGEPMIIIRSDGEAIFNKATVRGHIEATSGYIGGVDINAQSIQSNGNVDVLGYINTSLGFLSNKYFGSAINRAGWEIFETFAFIPIGKKLTINGGGVLLNNTPDGGTNNFHNCIVLWVDRINSNMIEIRGYPITSPEDRWVLCQCKRSDTTIVSHRFLFSW